jgi:nicotinamidase-related amidase
MSAASSGPRRLGPHTVHVIVDMQRLFAEATDWSIPSFADILRPILALVKAHPAETLYTRFLTPHCADDAQADWQTFYARWPTVTLDRMDASLLDLVEPLAGLAPPAEVYDKTVYSAFSNPGFVASLSRRQATTVLLTGVETDVCVLATAFDAVDHGLHVIVVADAVTSASRAGHRAALDAIYPRLDRQIEIMTANDVLALWPKD